MKQKFLFSKLLAVATLLLVGVSVKAATFYVRPFENSTAWNNISGANIKTLATGNVFTYAAMNATPAASGADTYYFAPGTYNINATFALTTGKVYGGFSGNESSVTDLTTRVTTDLDANGIVEPWEFSNVVAFTTSIAANNYGGATGYGGRLITVLGGEINGITITDMYCVQSSSYGVIVLGQAISTPTDNTVGSGGQLNNCIVRKNKVGSASKGEPGIVALSNAASVVNQCLIEDNNVPNGSGTVYLNKFGGSVSNSVIRNNYVSGNGGGVFLSNTPTSATVAVVKNSAIYNNTSGAGGSAIYGAGTASTKGIEVINCTVVNNKATSGTNSSSVELINNGLVENSIVVSDFTGEIRTHSLCNYIVSTLYGVSGSNAVSPSSGNNNTPGIADVTASPNTSFVDLGFKTATTFRGAVGNVGEASYDATNAAAIKTANYTITSGTSAAVTTTSSSLTTSYTADSKTVTLAGIVPTTDMLSVSRSGSSTIGAYQYDNTAPTVTISSSASSPTSTSPIPVTFTFSENVTGFAVEDVTVGNGTLSAITAVTGKVFTATITPTTGGSVTVDVPLNGVKDASGNNNTASSQFSITYELVVTAPVGVSTTDVTSITGTTATSGVSYTSNGGSAILFSGIVWSTNSNPEIVLSTKTVDGSGSITDLANNTTYFVRAYATNASGTTYGSELSFTTKWTITTTTNNENGTATGAGDVANNASITLTATATVAGKRFVSWTDNGTIVSLNRAYTFTATSNRTLVANFGDVYTSYYVRPAGNTTKWNDIVGVNADQIISTDNFNFAYNASNAYDGTATYYFAASPNYIMPFGNIIVTTGKLIGGFSGDETSIDLNARVTSDLDGNGVVEPWEFSNAAVFSAQIGYRYADNNTTTGARLLIVSGVGGEVNGITITDFNYMTYAGAIALGYAAGNPTAPNNNEGKMTKCIVRKIKSHTGVVMLTNPASVVDQCLIEDCFGSGTYGAVYLNRYGGTLSNSVIRNNKATTEGGAIYAGNALAATDLKAIVKNCLIYNNEATTKGGAISSKSISTSFGGVEIVNSTIANNKTGSGNASVELEGTGMIVNSIITGDTKADLFATTNAVTYLNGVVYNILASGSAALTTTNTVAGQAYNALNFERPTSTPGYLGLTVDATYTAMRAAKFNVTNVSSPAVTTTAGAVTTYSGVNVYSSVPTTDITGFTRTGTTTLGAYQATLDVATGSPVTINQNVNLARVTVAPGAQLTLSEGKTLTTTDFTINSNTGDGTATFVDANADGGLTVSGATTVNQNLETTPRRTWYMSSPVADAQPTGMDRIKSYNEANNSWSTLFDSGLTSGQDAQAYSGSFTMGKGYLVIPVSGNNIAFLGALNSGIKEITLTKTTATNATKSGFNLIGNPYPSFLDWTAVYSANSTKLSNATMWYRTKVGEAYTFWTVTGAGVGSPAEASNKIPPMQAFWVRTAADGNVLTLNKDMRSHAPESNKALKAPAAASTAMPIVRLQVSNGINTDEAVIYFSANASNGRDAFDAPKMSNENAAIPEIYTTLGTEQIVINGMNTIPMDQEIGLGFVAGNATSFSLKANEVSNLPADVKLILKDNVTNAETDVTDGVASYAFAPLATSGNRFSVIFRTAGAVTGVDKQADSNKLMVYSNQKDQITLVNNDLLNVGSTVSVYNAVGQKLMSKQITGSITQLDGNFTPGVYVVKVNNVIKKVFVK